MDPRTVLLPVHIVAGGLAIILGGMALLAAKGRWLHRQSGLLFVYAMLTMGISGSLLALRQSLTNANVLGGFMSAYFVVTALTTVREPTAWTRRGRSGDSGARSGGGLRPGRSCALRAPAAMNGGSKVSGTGGVVCVQLRRLKSAHGIL